MKGSKIRAVFLAMLLFFAVSMIMIKTAYGYSSGGAGGTSAGSGCTQVCTSTGARWQWYQWPDDADSVYFEGANSGVVSGITITGCSDAGGFWRYAPVLYTDHTKQIGAINLSGNTGSSANLFNNFPYNTWGSNVLTWSYGGKSYLTQYGASMADVGREYQQAREIERANNNGQNPILTEEWGGKIAWFCGPAPASAQSAVYYNTSSGGSGWGNTGIVSKIGDGYAETNTAQVKSGDTVTVGFLHNPYTSQPSDNVSWSITFGATSDGGYSVTNKSLTSRSGAVDLNTAVGNLYTVASRPYSGGNYSLNETYTLKFNDNAKGHKYEFCEIYSVYGTPKTRVCAYIEVAGDDTPSPQDGLCETWKNETINYTKSGKMEGWTEVINKVNNTSLTARNSNSAYSKWQREKTYAKPTDNVSWMNCYYPGVQEVANTEVTYDHKAHSGGNNSNVNPGYSDSRFGTWQNKFTVTPATGSRNWTSQNGWFVSIDNSRFANFGVGNTTIQSESNNYVVKRANDVSAHFNEKIESGIPTWAKVTHDSSHRWGCCGKYCTACHHHTNVYGTGQRSNNIVSDNAEVIVPYNFKNTAGLSTNNDSAVVYAGEDITVESAWVNIGEKWNDLTQDTYTTQVDNARVKLMGYVTTGANINMGERRVSGGSGDNLCTNGNLLGNIQKQCAIYAETNTSGTTLNPDGKLNGLTEYNGSAPSSAEDTKEQRIGDKNNGTFNGTFNVFDASAGDYFCLVMAVWPSASGGDDNTDANGDKQWYISKPVCREIAKRPSMQVLGGDIFSNGIISTSVAGKLNIYGAYNYNVAGSYGATGRTTENFATRSNSNGTAFGSWGELGVTSNGKVTGFASGAGTGLSSNGALAGSLGVGGSNFCNKRTSLSFANYGTNGILGNLICPHAQATGGAGITNTTIDRASLVDYWIGEASTNVGGGSTINLTDENSLPSTIASATGKTIRYAYSEGGLTIDGAWGNNAYIGKEHTYVIKAGGAIAINDNIIYSDGDGFDSAGQIPKVIIYSKGDITIDCTVTQLDAIIIANGKVNTCNEGDVNSPRRSSPLTVRGVIISNSLEANRTYGASMGYSQANSGGLRSGIPSSGSATPAEVINYDTSAILWGRYMAGSAESDVLTVTYQHELAPRY